MPGAGTMPNGSARSVGVPGAATARAGSEVRAHLTRRGKAAVLLVLLLALVGTFVLGRSASAAPGAGPSPDPVPTTASVTVQPGDSLWSLARSIAPRNDTRQVVGQIRRLNGLTTAELRVGQSLQLPVPAGR